jgi:Na+-transporting methylmalonyl-CoA/oxaloacetate decarboxylase gamma subunit
MSTEMTIALQITLIGMGLVFGAILLLWALMAVLVRVAAEPIPETCGVTDNPAGLERKRRAALAAIAVALAQQRFGAPVTPGSTALPTTAHVSAWQAVTRSQQLKQRGPIRR